MFIKGVLFNWDEVDAESYLHHIPAIRNVREIRFQKPVTFFAGENGTGKSTLLEAMAISEDFNPEGGSRNYCFSTFDSHSELCDSIRLIRSQKAMHGYFLRAESFYNVATKEIYYNEISSVGLHKQSHGESFLTVVQSNFDGEGIFFLDEPEAALSPQRLLTLLIEIDRARKQGAQFFIVTHSPILLGLPDAEIFSFDDDRVHPCAYEETGSVRLTSRFIRDRERILNQLLDTES